jgi:hypothetical protein
VRVRQVVGKQAWRKERVLEDFRGRVEGREVGARGRFIGIPVEVGEAGAGQDG